MSTSAFRPRGSDADASETQTADTAPHPTEANLPVDTFLADVRARLNTSLAYAETLAADAMHGLDASPLVAESSLEASVRDLVEAGGKLVRPRLVRLGFLATRTVTPGATHAFGEEQDAVVRLASAFELLHVFGLLQDDVMDGSETRRGLVSAHRRVADAVAHAHPEQVRGVAADRVGESVAVLAGDLAFALAGRLVRGLPERVADAWDATVVELVQGQRLDLVFAAEGRLDERSTMRVAQAKSGAYTVLRPLETGALLAGASTPPGWLTTYGHALGEAFALADDVIGIWGNPAVTGKPVGDDLRERKPSSVMGLADTMLDGELSRRFAPGSTALDAEAVDHLVARMDAVDVRAEAERRIGACRATAIDALPDTLDASLRDEFVRFADTLCSRDA